MQKKGSNIFEIEKFGSMTAGLELAQFMLKGKLTTHDPDTISPEISRQLEDLVVADAHSCSCCSVTFLTPAAQRAHFKLDWHRYNIKRQLAGLSTVNEEAFAQLADRGDDIESISGSESETEGDGDKSDCFEPTRHPKVFFKNNQGQLVSIYRCLLFSSKDYPEPEFLVNAALQLARNDKWAVIMLGGGHFAAGIFKGQEPLVHKTFHCYTVRAKQGGSQSTRDSKGGSHPKSAGASLRRYNEQALVQHVQGLISTWDDHFKSCNFIFYRAVGPHNRSVLFGGKTPPLDKADTRLRTIPFPTRRATFNEVKRVHGILSYMEVHGSEADFESMPLLEPKYASTKEDETKGKNYDFDDKGGSPRRSKIKKGVKPNRAKSRPSPQRALPAALPETPLEREAVKDSSDLSENPSDMGSKESLQWEESELKFNDNIENLKFDNLAKSKVKPKKEKSREESEVASNLSPSSKSSGEIKKEERQSADELVKQKISDKRAKKQAAADLRKQQELEKAASPIVIFQKKLLAVLQSGDNSKLLTCLSPEFLQTLPSQLPEGLERSLNLPIASGKDTALHIASKSGAAMMVITLLTSGADPTILNQKSRTPFVVASNEEVKEAFKHFRQQQPDKYDYSIAGIPLPPTQEELKQNEERLAALKRAKKEQQKANRKLKLAREAERKEQETFMALSDREKRALAAENRILAAQRRGTVDESKKLVLNV